MITDVNELWLLHIEGMGYHKRGGELEVYYNESHVMFGLMPDGLYKAVKVSDAEQEIQDEVTKLIELKNKRERYL